MNVSTWRRGSVGLLAVGVVVGGLGWLGQPASAREAPQRDRVFLIQGTPGAVVDVSLDGHLVAPNAQVKDIVGPLAISPGRHTVSFAGGNWVVPASFRVSTLSTDVVLHMPAQASAKPVVTVFNNDVEPIAPGKGRLVIAHTAVVPPADVRVDGAVLFSNIANGEFIGADVPAQTYSADIVPTGQDTPLFGPVDIAVKAGALTRVFAIGQPTNGGMDAIVQVLSLRSSGSTQPKHVDTGSAGLVATGAAAADHPEGLWLVLGGLAALLAIFVLRRRTAG